MLFNATSTIHSHLTQEQRMGGMKRRAEWQYPAGVKVVHEVWRSSAPHIVTTFECDSFEPILAIQLAWTDFMEMSIAPCITPEDGLRAGAAMMKK
jgi:hypothetical protein